MICLQMNIHSENNGARARTLKTTCTTRPYCFLADNLWLAVDLGEVCCWPVALILFRPGIRSKRIPVNELRKSHESSFVASRCAPPARQSALAARRSALTAQFGIGRDGFLCIKCANHPFLLAAGLS